MLYYVNFLHYAVDIGDPLLEHKKFFLCNLIRHFIEL
jgi:hypothetical protein